MRLSTIALNNLRRRSGRMMFLVLGLSIGIATIVSLVTMVRSLSSDIERKMEEFGANILITPRSDDLAMGYGGISLGGVIFQQSEIRQEDLDRLKTIRNHENIREISPKLVGGVTVKGKRLPLAGVDFQKEMGMKQWWRIFGRTAQREDELLLGSEAARVLILEPGEMVEIGGDRFTVAGVLEETGSQDDGLIFTHLPVAQKILGRPGKLTLVEVAALCSGCPIGDMVNQIAEVIPEAKVSAIQQVVAGRMAALEQFRRFSLVIGGVVLFIGSLIVFVTMTGSVTERRVEIGVFRAIGFRKRHIMTIILLEGVVVSLISGVLGFLLGIAGGKGALPFMVEGTAPPLSIDWWLFVGAVLVSVTLGVLASIWPARRGASMDPAEALRAL